MNSAQILAQSASFPWQCLTVAVTAAAAVAVAALICTRRSKARLREQPQPHQRDQTHLRMVVGQMPTVVWTVDADLRFTSCAGAGMIGLQDLPPEMVGMDFYTYFKTADPTFTPIAHHLAALRGESADYEFFWNNCTF